MLNITSIGTVMQTSTHHGVMFGKPVIYPDGYTVERAVFSSSQLPVAQAGKPIFTYKALSTTSAVPLDEPYFTAAIHWVKGQPTFTITRSDSPAEKIYTDSKSATTAWRKALQDAMKDFPSRQAELPVPMDSKSKLQVNGIRMYGLHLKDVHDELLALPGGQTAFDAAAAAAASAGPAISTEAAGAAELDAHSTSLLSPPGSQPQAKTQRLHTISPTPKSSAKSSPKAHSSARSSKRRTTPTRRASVDKDGSPATSTVDVGTTVIISSSSLTDGAAIIPEKRQRTHRSKGPNKAAATPEPTAAITEETAEITAAAPAKRRRTSSKKPSETVRAPAVAPTPVLVTVVCPDCGLGDTPFCSTTGKPHVPPPCTVCGLTTAFCPVTGQPHIGAVQRENRQRGEVHLPGAARKSRRLVSKHLPGVHAAAGSEGTTMAVAGAEDDGSAVDAVKGAGAAKKLRQKRLRNEGEAKRASGDDADAFEMGTTEKPARARRARKTKDGAAAAAPSSESVVEGTTVMRDGTAVASPAAVVVKSPPAPVEEPAYTYPPLRPPLTPREHHKAAHLLQENWKVQYGDGSVLPAAVAAVPLAFVPAKRMAAAGANRRGRGHGGASGGGASGEDGKQSDDDEDGGEEETGSARAKDRDEDGDVIINRSNTKGSLGSAVGGPTPTTAAAVAFPKMVHPLEVTQLATSVAGKRLSRFLLQYTSERTFFDLLKNSSSAADGSAGRKTSKQPAQQTPAGTDAGAGDEGGEKTHTVSDDGDGKNVLDASGAAPTEGQKELVIREADAAEGVVLQEQCGAVRYADPPTATTSS
ncbi:hypothetical protein, conserved [Leishmania tarentolae]|uniref:Uncharacterized protein n=1 Tax=Leishmania tarentolae TaxID=5689 RepID=A0A640KK71_LEITA|nr:hypothetical protein, conserved [Leishmania tarentolae]